MKNKSYIYLLIAFIGASISAKAQNPVILNAENNRNSDIGMCWVFPGAVYNGASKINGQQSLRTGQLTGGTDYPNGAQSPYIKFNNSGNIKWKMRLDRWAGVVYRRFAIIKVSPQNNKSTASTKSKIASVDISSSISNTKTVPQDVPTIKGIFFFRLSLSRSLGH